MIKLTDFIANRLVEYGVRDVFMITGGGAMHLNDSLGKHPMMNYICNHHEQASAIAAEGYARVSGKLAVVNVTSGPGGLNTLTGVLGQWTDSVPVLYISGQVKRETTITYYPGLKIRQLGDQEADIISVVKPITKFATQVTDPNQIKKILDKAIYIATSGRPGPVWIDIPLDVQATIIDETSLMSYDSSEDKLVDETILINKQIDILIEKIYKSKSPLFYIGNGLRLSNGIKQFVDLIDKLNIPVVAGISGRDILWYNHPLYFGMPGICGDRLGNVMLQNSDLLIIIGTRVGIRQTGYEFRNFAPKAYKVMIDIDNAELDKPSLNIDLKIHSDIKCFLERFSIKAQNIALINNQLWVDWGNKMRKTLPDIFKDNANEEGFVNSYMFADKLFQQLNEGSIVITGNGTAYTSTYQVVKIKKGMRLIANQGCAAMGYDLPAAIGACIANNLKKLILITGDGSIMMNLQELQTIKVHQLPIKIFVLENQGYLAIKTTQKSFFNSHFVGSSPESGVVCSDFKKIAKAFDIKYIKIETNQELSEKIKNALKDDIPVLCEIKTNPFQTLYPKVSSAIDEKGKIFSKPLENMFPFLSAEDLKKCYYLKDSL